MESSRGRVWVVYQKNVWCQAITKVKNVKEAEVKIRDLTKLLGYSKQSYYKKIKTKEKQDVQESLILELVKEKRKLWKKGSERDLHAALKDDFEKHNVKMGRDKFFALLRDTKDTIHHSDRGVQYCSDK